MMAMCVEFRRSCCTRLSQSGPSCRTQARKVSAANELVAPLLITTDSMEKLRNVPLKACAVAGFRPINATLAADLACAALPILFWKSAQLYAQVVGLGQETC